MMCYFITENQQRCPIVAVRGHDCSVVWIVVQVLHTLTQQADHGFAYNLKCGSSLTQDLINRQAKHQVDQSKDW